MFKMIFWTFVVMTLWLAKIIHPDVFYGQRFGRCFVVSLIHNMAGNDESHRIGPGAILYMLEEVTVYLDSNSCRSIDWHVWSSSWCAKLLRCLGLRWFEWSLDTWIQSTLQETQIPHPVWHFWVDDFPSPGPVGYDMLVPWSWWVIPAEGINYQPHFSHQQSGRIVMYPWEGALYIVLHVFRCSRVLTLYKPIKGLYSTLDLGVRW